MKRLAVLVALAITPSAVFANNCVRDFLIAGGSVCTAMDVRIFSVTVLSGPPSCLEGDTVVVSLDANFSSSASSRYDIGAFVALDGGDALTGTCLHDYLPPPLTTIPPISPIRNGPWWSSDMTGFNTCGDIQQDTIGIRTLGGMGTQLPIACVDRNGNGNVDLSICMSWSPNQSHACNSVIDAIPEQPSQCGCQVLDLSGVFVVSAPLFADGFE